VLFTENDTNAHRLFGRPRQGHSKDGINDFIVHGDEAAVNPEGVGTKAAAHYQAMVPAGAMEWVYSKDAANGTVLALRAKDLGTRIFNVTMAALTTPEDLANGIKAVVPGAKVKIETPTATAVALPNMRGVSDQKTAKAILGYAPKYTMVEGLRDQAEWMKAHR